MNEQWVRLRGRIHEGMPPAFCPIEFNLDKTKFKLIIGLVYIGTPEGEKIGEFNEDTEKLTLYNSCNKTNKEGV
jgi:hypothetical protein